MADQLPALLQATGLPERSQLVLLHLGAPAVLWGPQFLLVACWLLCGLWWRFVVLRLHSIAWVHSLGLDQGPRLRCVEVFAGIAAITAAFRDLSLDAVSVEIMKRPAVDNLLTCTGWFRALSLVCRLGPGGALWCGTPCSTWVPPSRCAVLWLLYKSARKELRQGFLNRATSKRSSSRPLGDESHTSCREPAVTLIVLLPLGGRWCEVSQHYWVVGGWLIQVQQMS